MRLSADEYQNLMSKRIGESGRNGSKYRAKKTEVDGIIFDSGKEAERYVQLKFLQRAGKIRDLKLQVSHDIHVNGILICTYKADFDYWLGKTHVVEDTKGYKTEIYRLKKKLMQAVNKVTIKET